MKYKVTEATNYEKAFSEAFEKAPDGIYDHSGLTLKLKKKGDELFQFNNSTKSWNKVNNANNIDLNTLMHYFDVKERFKPKYRLGIVNPYTVMTGGSLIGAGLNQKTK